MTFSLFWHPLWFIFIILYFEIIHASHQIMCAACSMPILGYRVPNCSLGYTNGSISSVSGGVRLVTGFEPWGVFEGNP